jgi:4-hydroxybutyrate CoA-transferase
MNSPLTLSANEAIERLPERARIVASPGCGTPETLLTALADNVADLKDPVLFSGLQLGAYPFLQAAADGALSYRTWHPFGPARSALSRGVEYVPARASAVPGLLDDWETNAALVRVSPPDANGWCSLGPSASYVCRAVDRAEVVIAEVDPLTPRTTGDSMLHVSQLDFLVESDTPPCYFPSAKRDEISDRVAQHVLDLLPHGPTLQLGIGAIPEALAVFLGDTDLRGVRFTGMATDAMAGLLDSGFLDRVDINGQPPISAAELMGTATLMGAAHNNPSIVLRDSRRSHQPLALGRVPRTVAVNSALEVDLFGQVNAEMLGSRQVSGIGGSADFVEAGFDSSGGLSVIAIASTTPDGRTSRIVKKLGSDVISLPRHTIDVVVTEHGAAWLRGRTERERVEALIAVAHPDHRDALAD